jgi:pheromone shutdown protein TraB
VVIIGAGHIVGIEKELKENYPEIKVKLINE